MSLIDLIPRGRALVPTGPEKAPPIAAKIADAERQLEALRDERPEIALDAENGVDGAPARLAELKRQIADLEQRLDDLRLAHEAAAAADQRMFRQQRAAMFGTQVAASKKHLKARDAAARQLTKHIEEAVAAYREVILRSRQAMAANPVGGDWPSGSLCGDGELYRLVDDELYRLGNKVDAERIPSFPRRSDAHVGDFPATMVALPDRVARASEICVDNLMKRAPK